MKKNNDKYYTPSENFSFVGFMLIIVSVTVIGMVVSALYLKINQVCPSAYLCVVAACGFGALLGLISRIIIAKFKIRSPMMAVVATIIGLLLVTYFKWGLYDYWDLKKYGYEALEKQNAYTYYEFNYDFDDPNYTFEQTYEALQYNAYELFAERSMLTGYSEAQIAKMKKSTLYEWYGYDYLLGMDIQKAKVNLEKAKTMNAYEYYYEYMEINKPKTLASILTSPKMLWSDIKEINEYGRWSISSSSSSYSSSQNKKDSENTKGAFLWVVWIGELLVLCVFPVFMARSRASKPFVEKDNDWAKEYKTSKLVYRYTDPRILKMNLEANREALFMLENMDLTTLASGASYVKISVLHSHDYSESYLNVDAMMYTRNKNGVSYQPKCVVKYYAVDEVVIGRLFRAANMDIPSDIRSSPNWFAWDNNNRITDVSQQSGDGDSMPYATIKTPFGGSDFALADKSQTSAEEMNKLDMFK